MKFTGPEWKRLFGLLDTLLELADDERSVFLAKVALDSPHLAEQLRHLLAENVNLAASVHELAPLQLDDSDVIASRQRIKDSIAWREGAQVGPYRLIREIGHGGMSTVWLAVRSDGRMRRPLALKLPHVFMRDGRFAERFEREREILEALTHPNIARLYDAGVSENGQPYLGMEYVEGVSLLEYCNSARLTVRERLQVFLQVLAAVRYAHSQLVIHRDLKPSNILVTTQHQVSLLDFGIAKLTVAGEAQETELTRHGGRALTPDYASPEHIAGLPLSTGSDVYSLGVVLFELLTGQRPYRPKRDSRGALEDAILSADAPHLAQCELAGQAELCNMSRAQLTVELRGDLDSIVQKALKKSAADRYGTADTFAQDLQRYLSNETVFARPDSTWYRAAKFLRRNKLLVGAVAATILALSVGLGLALWQAGLARTEAHTAEAVQTFMENLFRANSANQPDPLKARQLTARELLDLGAAQIDTALNDTPQAKLRVLKTLTDMYDDLGMSDQMLVLARKRVDIARTLPGTNTQVLAQHLVDLGDAAERVDLHAEAGRAFNEAERILEKAGDQRSRVRADLETSLAAYYDDVDPAKALTHADRGLLAWRALPRSDDSTYHLVNGLSGKAMISIDVCDFTGAEAAATEGLALAGRIGATANDQLLPLHEALAYAHWYLGSIDVAERDFRDTARVAAEGTGDVVMQKLEAEGPLADFLIDTGRVKDGLAMLQSELGEVDKMTGVRAASSRPARTVMRYGRALVNFGRIESGRDELERVLRIGSGFDATPEFNSKLWEARASVMYETGRYTEAESLLAKAVEAHKQAGEFLTIYENANIALHARVLAALGRISEASAALLTYRAGKAKSEEKTRPGIEPIIIRAELDLAQGDRELTILAANQVLTLIRDGAFSQYQTSWEMQASLLAGKAELELGHANDALPFLKRALDLGADLYDPAQSPRYADAQIALAECLLELGRIGEARKLYADASAIHVVHKELAEHYRKPLQHLKAHLAAL